jgi:hypothetical protein
MCERVLCPTYELGFDTRIRLVARDRLFADSRLQTSFDFVEQLVFVDADE